MSTQTRLDAARARLNASLERMERADKEAARTQGIIGGVTGAVLAGATTALMFDDESVSNLEYGARVVTGAAIGASMGTLAGRATRNCVAGALVGLYSNIAGQLVISGGKSIAGRFMDNSEAATEEMVELVELDAEEDITLG